MTVELREIGERRHKALVEQKELTFGAVSLETSQRLNASSSEEN